MRYGEFSLQIDDVYINYLEMVISSIMLAGSALLLSMSRIREKQIRKPIGQIWYEETYCITTLQIVKLCQF